MDTSLDRKQWSPIRAAVLAVVVAAAALSLLPGARGARAATGDSLGQITAATPACSVGTGVAFDGSHLILSCWGSNQLWRVSPADGSLIDTLTIAGLSDIGAMAWDGSRGKLWVCESGNQVYLADTSAQTATSQFSSGGCIDGLAYDGADGTLWASADASATLRHYKADGTLLGTFNLSAKLGGTYGNSGIAVGGNMLYLANNGGSQIYQCTKDLVTCTLMSTFPRRLEDLECDNVTFAPKGAIWSIDAYDRTLNAWEIPSGTCSFGGGVGSQPTPAPTQAARPTPCIGGIVSSRCPANPPAVVATQPPAPTATSIPPTAMPPQPTATKASQVLGVVKAPNTGSGPGEAETQVGWLLLALAALTGGAMLSAVAVRSRRR